MATEKAKVLVERIQKLEQENQQLIYKTTKAEERANRNEFLANSGRAFENEIIWLRKLVETLTSRSH